MIYKNTTTFAVKKRIFRNTPGPGSPFAGAKRLLHTPNSMSFLANTEEFPLEINTAVSGSIGLSFYNITSITVDWGDGTRQTNDTVFDGATGLWRFSIVNRGDNVISAVLPWSFGFHTYADFATNPNHVVTIYYNASTLAEISINNCVMPIQDFAFGFSQHENMILFNLNGIIIQPGSSSTTEGSFLSLDLKNIEYCESLRSLGLTNCFAYTSIYYGAIPELLLQRPLTNLGFGDNGFLLKTFEDSHMNDIVKCKDTLLTLTMAYQIKDINVDGDPALPANWIELINLNRFHASTFRWTTPPPLLNDITWLTDLLLRGSAANVMTSWGDLGNLVNLKVFWMSQNSLLDPVCPAYLANFTKLKEFNVAANYKDGRPGAMDTFIMTMYNVIIPAADMTEAGDAFRNVVFNCGRVSANDGTSVPSGSFTEPAGYEQGMSNGIASDDTDTTHSLERLWVLTNQYQWACNYAT